MDFTGKPMKSMISFGQNTRATVAEADSWPTGVTLNVPPCLMDSTGAPPGVRDGVGESRIVAAQRVPDH
jgi:hypothetical protein